MPSASEALIGEVRKFLPAAWARKPLNSATPNSLFALTAALNDVEGTFAAGKRVTPGGNAAGGCAEALVETFALGMLAASGAVEAVLEATGGAPAAPFVGPFKIAPCPAVSAVDRAS